MPELAVSALSPSDQSDPAVTDRCATSASSATSLVSTTALLRRDSHHTVTTTCHSLRPAYGIGRAAEKPLASRSTTRHGGARPDLATRAHSRARPKEAPTCQPPSGDCSASPRPRGRSLHDDPPGERLGQLLRSTHP